MVLGAEIYASDMGLVGLLGSRRNFLISVIAL